MDLISRFDVGQTVAAPFSSDRQEASFHPKKKKKGDNPRAELAGLRRRSAKEKIASIKSNPSWDNGLQNQFQATICLITLICHFFFNYISIPAT